MMNERRLYNSLGEERVEPVEVHYEPRFDELPFSRGPHVVKYCNWMPASFL